MSSTVAILQSFLVANYCAMASTTLILWEYLAHLPQEIDLFWKRKLSGASVLFLSNRYLSLLVQIYQFPTPTSDKSCDITVKASLTIQVLPYFSWAVFSALRTHALCPPHLRWPLGMLVLILSSVPIWVNLAGYRWLSANINPTIGCISNDALPLQLDREFVILSRTCLIVADFVVLAVTWYGTYHTIRLVQAAAGEQRKHTYSETLLRDGTTYFVILAILNFLHLLFTLLSIAEIALQSTSFVTAALTDPITSILVSRFLLDLQEVSQYRADPQLASLSVGQGSLHFNNSRVIGSLGESLPPPGDTSLEDERLAAEDASEDNGDEVGQEVEAIVEEARA
ncbi:hypothetical protein L226DRAFT_560872 [Lentinus tigrinus ALCF2SS1-7]|uniref:uncharacterized protein n=1 Tax=Lentinus tigrinus ALCF2SS1-7 TaxID=1328758 RepID=UPI0011663EC4|nr:hypothetical protein L226DRAFT_560872 [Lentinus tigrinus ALCF2SS1-7]